MTRSMGDATHDNVAALVQAGPWDVVAGYVTGTSDIRWSPPDWAAFPGSILVTIDQGGIGSPVPVAIVRDFEQGAWTASEANEHIGAGLWTPARPTVYSDQATLPGIVADGWRRDLWVAIIGWLPGDPWPTAVQAAIDAGCTVVAVQNAQGVNGTYDSSVVLDPTWPGGGNQMDSLLVKGSGPGVYFLNGGKMAPVQDQQSLTAIQGAGVQLVTVTDATLTAWLAAFPPGQPTVTVGSITFPSFTTTPNPAAG